MSLLFFIHVCISEELVDRCLLDNGIDIVVGAVHKVSEYLLSSYDR